MRKYPVISDESILLDRDSEKMLRRDTRKIIIDEILNRLENTNKNNKKNIETIKKNKSFYKNFLTLFGYDK